MRVEATIRHRLGLAAEQVLPRAQELAEGLAARPQLLTRYLAVTVRQRLSRRMAEATQLGMALEKIALEDDYFVSRKLYPNVDFYSGLTYHLLGIPLDLFTPIFAVSRVAGWTAHVIEYWEDNRLVRPLDYYVGPTHNVYVPVERRA